VAPSGGGFNAAHRNSIAELERHAADAERRVACQKVIIEQLVRDRHSKRIIIDAQSILNTLEHSLRLAKKHLEIERKYRADPGREA